MTIIVMITMWSAREAVSAPACQAVRRVRGRGDGY